MSSLRRHEGYVMVDHRQTQGLPDEMVVNAGLPVGAGRGLFESATYTCSHCKTVVVLNPLRNRDRAYCKGCDHYICDPCGKIRADNAGECRSFDKFCDQVQEAAVRGQDVSKIVTPW